MARTVLLKSRYRKDNAHSFACVYPRDFRLKKITRRETGGFLFFAFSHKEVSKAECCEREKFVKNIGKAKTESDDIMIPKMFFAEFFYDICRHFFDACFFGIVLVFYKVVDFFNVLEISAVFRRNDGSVV